MQIETIQHNGHAIAVIGAQTLLLTDVQSALDLMMTVRCETGCDRLILQKDAVCEDFFILSTRLAGEVLQKFQNYQLKLAICGDFSGYTSKPLRDFIRESNQGRDFFFVATQDEALAKLSQ